MKKLTVREYLSVALMLFGLFFGAGNLIFPVKMGQMSGANVIPALLGFLVTGVGLPLLGVAALGISGSEGLYDLTRKVDRRYAMVFTCMLYLTIGPFFAIPRCANTSFTVGVMSMLPSDANVKLWTFVFSLAFFAAALAFSLFPGRILTWVGKLLTPIFLVFLAVLVIVALASPTIGVFEVAPEGAYVENAFSTGFLEGYNTMDVLAGLAFGIVVVEVIRRLGVTEPEQVAASTVRAGVFSCLFMALIYVFVTLVGVVSRGVFTTADNGGIALAQIAEYHLGKPGLFILAGTVTFACLKTAVGLITSCAETFDRLFPKRPGYRVWVVIFSAISFGFANFGLDRLIEWSIPVLMFLYPLAISLVLLALFGKWFDQDRTVYLWVTGAALIGAVYDFLSALPSGVRSALHLDGFLVAVGRFLPLSSLGLGWLCPAALGAVIGLTVHFVKRRSRRTSL